jgi:hypothetical protein
MNVGAVMQEVADRLDTITNLRVFAHPVKKATAPYAVVDYPDDYTYDATYGRGMDQMTLPVVVWVSNVTDRSAREAISGYLSGSGSSSVKEVLESGTYTEFDVLRVASAALDIYTMNGTDYLVAVFSLEIAGQGA